jgi:hypothetical protein
MSPDGPCLRITALERICDRACRMGLPQVPPFRAAADRQLVLFKIYDAGTAWPTKVVERNYSRPTCVLIGADPGVKHPDLPAPSEWACAKRLKYWCQDGGAIIHGAGGELDHYREAARATLLLRRLAFIETTSHRADEWADYLRSRSIRPADGPHLWRQCARRCNERSSAG